jgi:hypothetical protein
VPGAAAELMMTIRIPCVELTVRIDVLDSDGKVVALKTARVVVCEAQYGATVDQLLAPVREKEG